MNTGSGFNQTHSSQHCLNCGRALEAESRYCPECGQKTTTGLIPLKSLIGEYFETIFNIDSRFLHTVKWLFVPGYLTKEFFRGKHVSYFRPLRLFFITLVILYAVLGLTAFSQMEVKLGKDSGLNYQADKRALQTLDETKSVIGYDSLPAQQRASIDSLARSLQQEEQSSFNITYSTDNDSTIIIPLADIYDLELDSIYKKYNITSFRQRILTQQLIRARKEPGKAIQSFIANTSWMIILLMPALAMILKVLYLRSKRFYIEHLVFLYHYHAAVFVTLTLYVLTFDYLPSWLAAMIPVLIFVFLFFAMQAYYRQGIFKTLLKYLTLLSFYVFLLTVFVGLTAIVSLMLYQG